MFIKERIEFIDEDEELGRGVLFFVSFYLVEGVIGGFSGVSFLKFEV